MHHGAMWPSRLSRGTATGDESGGKAEVSVQRWRGRDAGGYRNEA
jgi:hypothetical protein